METPGFKKTRLNTVAINRELRVEGRLALQSDALK
jgi:hypothetical protein